MTIDLAGRWAFQLDPADQGVNERWYLQTLTARSNCLARSRPRATVMRSGWRRHGSAPSSTAPFTPITAMPPIASREHSRCLSGCSRRNITAASPGPALVTIPEEWRGQRITLTLERPHWETTVWLDDRCLGRNDSLATAHVYDLGTQVAPGEHRLTIRVDNRVIVDVGPNAHSITDHTQSNWNGIVGRIELTAGSPAWLRNVRVFPDVARSQPLVKIDVASVWGKSARGKVTVSAQRTNVPGEQALPAVSADFGFSVEGGLSGWICPPPAAMSTSTYRLGDDAQTWDEFHPALYALTVDLDGGRRRSRA